MVLRLCYSYSSDLSTFFFFFFFFNDTATTEIYTLSLHDALPILSQVSPPTLVCWLGCHRSWQDSDRLSPETIRNVLDRPRSEEHTSELQSQSNLVCRLLLEKKKHTMMCRHTHTLLYSCCIGLLVK